MSAAPFISVRQLLASPLSPLGRLVAAGRHRAASAGAATGRVRQIHRIADGEDLQPGEILVAVTTDPSWTPLFMIAGGIVLEQGGPLSHAAIVARELELPAVLNVPDAMRRLPNGTAIEVDGTNGVIRTVAEREVVAA